MTAAKLGQLAWKLDTWARYLRLTGLDDGALVAAMFGRTVDIRTLLNAAGASGMEGFPSARSAHGRPASPAWRPAVPRVGSSVSQGLSGVPPQPEN